jgi:hypothetical protein
MFSTSKALFRKPAGASPTTDPSFAYVPLLLNTTSTNGQQNNTFLDSSSNTFTITRNGTPTQGSITPYWPNGQWSNYFNGSNAYLTSTIPALSGQFTIDFWFYRNATGNNYCFTIGDSLTSTGIEVYIGAGGSAFLIFSNNTTQITSSTLPSVAAWNYVAVTRDASNVVRMYLNGTQVGSTWTTSVTFATTLRVGVEFYNSGIVGYGNNYISNFRISNNVRTVTSVPASFFVADGNTLFLGCQSNRFRDTSSNNATVTPSGTPTVQAFQPFSPTASYTTALYGGSGYFTSAASSYLSSTITAPNSSIVSFECWVYNLVLDGTQGNHYITLGTTNYLLTHNTGGVARWKQASDAGTSIFDIQSASGVLKLNQWQYMVGIRSGSNAALYVDGVRVGTATGLGAVTATQTTLYVSSNQGSGRYTDGYLSNVRIQSGTLPSGYDPTSTTIAVPTTPLAAVTGTLFLGNMTNAGIYDAAAQNVITTVGDAQVSTTITAKWPPTSMKYDGTGDWLTAIDSTQLQLGTGDFTIDGWVYLSAIGVVYGILSKGTATTGWSVNVTVLNKLQFSYTTSNLTGTTTLATGTWYYFAVVRSGSATGNLKLYLNGSVEATSGGAVTDNFNQTDILYVGASRTGTTPLNGYLQDVRITKAARTITTPTAAFPTR